MNELERRANQALRTLDEAHRLGRLTRADYRARRRELLTGLRDSNGVTERNVIVPAAPKAAPRDNGARRTAAPMANEASTLFPERRASALRLAVLVGGMVLLALALVLWMLGHGAG